MDEVSKEGWSHSRDLVLKDRAEGISTLAAEIAACADCQAAMKHAYSDATTPGFFYDRCEKHRKLPVDSPDIRNAVGVVTVEEMPIEEAKQRFPGLSGTTQNMEPFRPTPATCAILFNQEATDETRATLRNQNGETEQGGDPARGIQPGSQSSDEDRQRLASGRANEKSEGASKAAARQPRHSNLRNKKPKPVIKDPTKIPGVKTAAESATAPQRKSVPRMLRSPRNAPA